jgi:hypothetical protein
VDELIVRNAAKGARTEDEGTGRKDANDLAAVVELGIEFGEEMLMIAGAGLVALVVATVELVDDVMRRPRGGRSHSSARKRMFRSLCVRFACSSGFVALCA